MKTGLAEWDGEEQTDRLHQLIDWVQPRFLIPTVSLPSLEVVWKWNWRRTWDVPPWRA